MLTCSQYYLFLFLYENCVSYMCNLKDYKHLTKLCTVGLLKKWQKSNKKREAYFTPQNTLLSLPLAQSKVYALLAISQNNPKWCKPLKNSKLTTNITKIKQISWLKDTKINTGVYPSLSPGATPLTRSRGMLAHLLFCRGQYELVVLDIFFKSTWNLTCFMV